MHSRAYRDLTSPVVDVEEHTAGVIGVLGAAKAADRVRLRPAAGGADHRGGRQLGSEQVGGRGVQLLCLDPESERGSRERLLAGDLA